MKDIHLVVSPMVEKGEPLLIGWKASTPPPVARFNGDYYRFSPLTRAFSYYEALEGAKYYLKLYPRASGYVRVGTFSLPVYVVSPSEKISQFVVSSFSQRGLKIEKPSPLVDVIASSIALALTSSGSKLGDTVLDSVPQGYTLIAAFDALSDERFLVEDSSQRDGIFKYTDGKSKIVYRIPVSPKAKDLVLSIKVGNDFEIYASADGKNWNKVVNSVDLLGRSYRDFKNYRWYHFKLPLKLPSNRIYIKIGDATPENGWGAKFSEVKVYGRLP